MTKTIMKAVGAVAAGRNRKVHMRIASVTIYCDEGSKGSNPATPTKATDNQWLFLFFGHISDKLYLNIDYSIT